MTAMPILKTARLQIRPLAHDDLAATHRILDVELGEADLPTAGTSLEERARWLQWTILGYEQFASLHQPPYGERAIVLTATAQVIGAVGFVPCLMPFEQLPQFAAAPAPGRLASPEFGLYWAVSPAFRRQGYATEAGQAMVEYAFSELRVKRVVASTTYENAASVGVMHKLGMWVERNPFPDPPWLQVVGLLENPGVTE
jgi:[ribosomal protein S5]-alanine N-acetyltransferase